MALAPYLTLFLLLSLTHANPATTNLKDQTSLINCITDAIVLEGILLRAAAHLASGIYIPNAIEDLQLFWSLIPEWTATCKNIFSKPSSLSLPFPEHSKTVYSTLRLSSAHSDPVKVPQDCLEGFLFSAKHVYSIGKALEQEQVAEAQSLFSSLAEIASVVIAQCKQVS